jgi:hypothetical protein
MTASFSPEDVTCLILEMDAGRNRLAIDLRTESLTLAPGQSLVMEQEYRVL